MADRLEALQAMLRDDPTNAFARYGLAMELSKSGELDAAMAEFRALLAHNPDYCAAYYHAGQTLERAGDTAGAAALYRDGIQAAERTGDAHTRSELAAALEILPL